MVFCILCRCRKTGLPEDSHEVIEENEMNKVKVEGEEDVAEQVVAEHHFKGKPGAGPVVVASCPGSSDGQTLEELEHEAGSRKGYSISLLLEALEEEARSAEIRAKIEEEEARRGWVSILSEDGKLLQRAPAAVKEDYECVFNAVKQNSTALKYACPALRQDKWLLAIAGQDDFPEDDKQTPLVCISKKYSFHPDSNDFSSLAIIAMRRHPAFRVFRLYNPDVTEKDFCTLKPGDYTQVTDPEHPCRGLTDGPARCRKRVSLDDGRPTTGSCWRYSYRWHEQCALDTSGFLLQIVDLVDGMPKLGAGQKLEQEMAQQIGLPIVRFVQKSVMESNECPSEDRIRELMHKILFKSWDTPFEDVDNQQ